MPRHDICHAAKSDSLPSSNQNALAELAAEPSLQTISRSPAAPLTLRSPVAASCRLRRRRQPAMPPGAWGTCGGVRAVASSTTRERILLVLFAFGQARQ